MIPDLLFSYLLVAGLLQSLPGYLFLRTPTVEWLKPDRTERNTVHLTFSLKHTCAIVELALTYVPSSDYLNFDLLRHIRLFGSSPSPSLSSFSFSCAHWNSLSRPLPTALVTTPIVVSTKDLCCCLVSRVMSGYSTTSYFVKKITVICLLVCHCSGARG